MPINRKRVVNRIGIASGSSIDTLAGIREQTGMLILASASPRRRELLNAIGLVFEVRPSDIPEVQATGEAPSEFAARLAREKARAVAKAGEWVLGADTIVVVDDEVLGKPVDPDDAQRMLRLLSGRAHEVMTAVALIAADGQLAGELVSSTRVEFRPLTPAEITAYVASGEPMDKAGAYAIQGGAAAFVSGIEGSHSNVVGLPREETAELLRRHGLLGECAESGDRR